LDSQAEDVLGELPAAGLVSGDGYQEREKKIHPSLLFYQPQGGHQDAPF
jgi:hypothetical protein